MSLKILRGGRLRKSVALGYRSCNVENTWRWCCTLPVGAYSVRVYATDIAGKAQRRVGRELLTVR